MVEGKTKYAMVGEYRHAVQQRCARVLVVSEGSLCTSQSQEGCWWEAKLACEVGNVKALLAQSQEKFAHA